MKTYNFEKNNAKKQTGIELLRVLAMLCIIMFHYTDHGTIDMTKVPLSFNWMVLALFRMGGGIGNCIFVLITGYLLYNKSFTLKRIIKLWMEVWCYSVGIGTICYLTGITSFSIKGLIKMVMPVTFNQYWYMSTYVILYFLMPFINTLIIYLNKKQHIYLICVSMFFFSFMPTFTKQIWISGANNLLIFIVLYLTGAYIEKYGIKGFSQTINIFIVFFSGVLIWISEIVLKKMGANPFYFSWGMNKFPIIFMAIFLFFIFVYWNPKLPNIVLSMASSVFGVYLLHIGKLHVWIFGEIFDNSKTFYNWYMIIQLLAATFSIFIISVVIDKLRYSCIERPLMKKLDRFIEKRDSYLKTFLP